MKPPDLQPYRDAVREEICPICIDHGRGGECGRPLVDPCALETHLGTVVESILSVPPTDDLLQYVAALRTMNCPHCCQDADGGCALRDLVDCAVDAYVPHLVEVIETVAQKCEHSSPALTR